MQTLAFDLVLLNRCARAAYCHILRTCCCCMWVGFEAHFNRAILAIPVSIWNILQWRISATKSVRLLKYCLRSISTMPTKRSQLTGRRCGTLCRTGHRGSLTPLPAQYLTRREIKNAISRNTYASKVREGWEGKQPQDSDTLRIECPPELQPPDPALPRRHAGSTAAYIWSRDLARSRQRAPPPICAPADSEHEGI